MTPEALRIWITAEFPHLPPPSEETLTALTANSTTAALWQFLTTRVYPRNAAAAKAALSLSGEQFTPREEGFDVTLRELHQEAGVLEREVDELRRALEGDDGDFADGGIGDAVHAAFEAREQGIRELVRELSSHGREESRVEEVLAAFGDEVTEDSLREVEGATEDVSQGAVMACLRRRYEDAEKRAVAVDTRSGDVGEEMERFAVDCALRAFKDFETARGEHERAGERVKRAVAGVGEEGFVRVVAAQLEGERAVARFAKVREVRERRARVAERDVRQVEDACRVVCEGSLRMLAEVRRVFEGRFWGTVEARVAEAVRAAEGMVEGLESGGGGGEGGEGVMCECEEREEEMRRVDAALEEVARRLGERRRVAEETTVSVLQRCDTGLVEHAIRQAENCRLVDAVRVRDELMAFVRQPGRAAAPWLRGGSLEKGGINED